jgi:hypothetical protein
MASQTGMAAPAIAALVGSVESHVGKVIHAFNEEGLDSLDPTTGAGAPRRRRPQSVTGSWRSRVPHPRSPEALVASEGQSTVCARRSGSSSPREALAQTLRGAGSHQRRHSWKGSPDLHFKERAERVVSL